MSKASVASSSDDEAAHDELAITIPAATRTQGTRWTFTLNVAAWDAAHRVLDELEEHAKKGLFKTLRAQLEVGENGNKHVQGAAAFASNKRFAALKTLIPGAHWEAMIARGNQAFLYCEKTDSLPPEGERRSIAFGEIKCKRPCALCGTKQLTVD